MEENNYGVVPYNERILKQTIFNFLIGAIPLGFAIIY